MSDGRGSNAMALLGTLLPEDDARGPLALLRQVRRTPRAALRALSARRWSERTVILLVIQARDVRLRVTARPVRLGGLRLRSALDGEAGGTVNDVLRRRATTAHVLGGVPVGVSAATGVVDPYGRVFGHPGPHVVDGSTVAANLGANPALTIAALAERAFALWPDRGDSDSRPPLGGGA